MATQWHPFFAELLRRQLEHCYEVNTNVPVGDVPREADVVVVRRTTAESTPFHGVWRHLKLWNVLEYKGPSVSARVDDVDLLVELGLGIQRRLNEERSKARTGKIGDSDVCFWYIANKLGRRFWRGLSVKLGSVEERGPGVWQARVLNRDLLFVSAFHVPVELDSVPLHILGQESPERQLEVARLVVQDQALLEQYAPYLESFDPEVVKEFEAMARTAKKGFKLNLQGIVDFFGMDEVVKQLDIDRVIETVGEDEVLKRIDLSQLKEKTLVSLLRALPPDELARIKRQLG